MLELEVLLQRRMGDFLVVVLSLDKNARDTANKTRGALLNRASPVHVSRTTLQRKAKLRKEEG